jgi:hypothetical protein
MTPESNYRAKQSQLGGGGDCGLGRVHSQRSADAICPAGFGPDQQSRVVAADRVGANQKRVTGGTLLLWTLAVLRLWFGGDRAVSCLTEGG